MDGRILRINLQGGYGFIEPSKTSGCVVNHFFHRNELDSSLEFGENLREMRVEFESTATEKGRRAMKIRAAN